MSPDKPKSSWKERGYVDKRPRPERDKRRFYMLEQNPESEKLMHAARARLAHIRGVPPEDVPFSQVMREALRKLAG